MVSLSAARSEGPHLRQSARSAWAAWLACAALAWPLTGLAQSDAQRHNTVQFSATAAREVGQDELSVTLEAVKEGAQASDVQAELKRVLENALAEARALTRGVDPDALSVQTGGFHLYPRHGSNNRINGWQGSAQVVIKGSDAAKVSQAAGKLQQLNITQVRYGLSRALRERNEATLTTEAIAQFKERARQIAMDFGMKGYTLGAVSVSATDPGFESRPVPMMAMKSAAAPLADAPLPVMPGKGLLSVTVSGEVILTP